MDVLDAYAGTGGIEGEDSLKGKFKPWVFGRASNVEPVQIDSINYVFQFSAYGPIKAVNALFERGADLGPSLGDAPTLAALLAANVPEGKWATCLALGLVRLGAPPAGLITADVDGDSPAGGQWIRRTGAIIRRVALRAGIDAANLALSIAGLDQAVDRAVNVVLTEQETVLALAARLALPCNAQAGVSWLGQLFVTRIALGNASVTLDAQGRQLPPVLKSTENEVSPPYKRIQMGGARNWRVQTFDEIAFEAPLIPKGDYAEDTVYREGNIVTLPDGSSWLYISLTPSAGHRPADNSEFWASLSGRTRATYDDGTPIEDLKPAEPGATSGAPAGTNVGGVPAEHVIDALSELASSPDPDKLVEGAKGLVDRTRETALTQIKNQLLAFARKTRTDSATHLDGIPMGARVRTEITERIEQGLALAQQIVEVEAAITGPDGPIAAAVTQLLQAIADGDHAQALALQALDAAITGPDGPIAAAVTQLQQAIADANSARAEAFEQLQAAITANGDALDAAFTQLNQAVVTEHDARVQADTDLKAEITGPSGPIAAAVDQLSLALADQQSATAQMIADLSASILGPNGAIAGTETRLSQAIADEEGARVTDVTTLKSRVGNNESSISLLFDTVNGEQAIAQLMVTVDAGGAAKITGFKIDGAERLFVVAADKFVVGDNQIFEVDTVSGKTTLKHVYAELLEFGSMDPEFEANQNVFDGSEGTQKLPGGVVMKWGRYRAHIGTEVQLSVVFETPFPNACHSFVPVPYLENFSIYRDLWLQNVGAPTRFGATVGTQAATSEDEQIDGFDWLAFGR
ncbi:hypothetical protein [Sphingomonas sp. NFR15]|uniref:gp53-like domain-containing protein n=1 Tax=Sphingomonas sp. NFR15 TaxID=1566282 RepID=UPI00115FB1A3|nr:hypothetical protein [Sphingomonas sp. NFR15]